MAFNTTVLAASIQDGLIIEAYDKFLRWQLRSMPVYRQFVDVHPQDPTNNALTVNLKRHDYLPAGTRTVDEVTDPTSLTAPQTINVPVTLVEYGAVVGRSYRLDAVTYVPIDPALGRQLATDVVDTMDGLIRDTFLLGTNRSTSNAGAPEAPVATNTLTAADVISARLVRRAVRDLRKRNAVPWRGDKYVAVISPEVAVDLREDVGSNSWQDPHINVDPAAIYNGEIGTYEGAVFVETNRAFRDTDGAAGAEVHRTLFLGREGVAQAVKKEPGVGISPLVDKLARHRDIFWHGFFGQSVYRQEPIQRLETGVSA